jgi:type III secretion protein V
MLEWAQREKETVIIAEYVRQALGRYIAHKFSNGTYIIPCLLLDGEIEDMIRDAIRFNGGGSYLSLDPNVSMQLIEKIQEAYLEQGHIKVPIVIVTQMDIRRYVRSIIEKDLSYIHVLSFQEIESHVQFNSLGVIEI